MDELFASDQTKSFAHMNDYGRQQAELALSFYVIFHLVEDDVFESYMRTLFRCLHPVCNHLLQRYGE